MREVSKLSAGTRDRTRLDGVRETIAATNLIGRTEPDRYELTTTQSDPGRGGGSSRLRGTADELWHPNGDASVQHDYTRLPIVDCLPNMYVVRPKILIFLN